MYLSSFHKTLTGAGFLLSHLIPLDPVTRKKITMRLKFMTLLLTITLVHTYARSIGQITLHQKNARLVTIFRSIEQQTDYVFLYDNQDLYTITGVTIDFNKASIDEVMKEVLKGLPLSYRIVDRTILVKKSVQLRVAAEAVAPPPPPVRITGKVTNSEDGAPLPGASVRDRSPRRRKFRSFSIRSTRRNGRPGWAEGSAVRFPSGARCCGWKLPALSCRPPWKGSASPSAAGLSSTASLRKVRSSLYPGRSSRAARAISF